MVPRAKLDPALIPKRPDLSFEKTIWRQGLTYVVGVDEAGRGSLAGPVSAGAVILPGEDPQLMDKLVGVRDSKLMTPTAREVWAGVIKEVALAWAVGFATACEIDQVGIVPATCLAAKRALDKLAHNVDFLLIDYITLPDIKVPQKPLIKGDARSLTIASAAILAKTTRDAILVEMDEEFPGYNFASNKGYATKAHRLAIKALGPCKQHRKSFSPIAEFYSLFPPDLAHD